MPLRDLGGSKTLSGGEHDLEIMLAHSLGLQAKVARSVAIQSREVASTRNQGLLAIPRQVRERSFPDPLPTENEQMYAMVRRLRGEPACSLGPV